MVISSSGLGRDRPVSTKLRWRVDMPTSTARSSWLRRRRVRHSRSSDPTGRATAPRGVGGRAHGTRPYGRGRMASMTSEVIVMTKLDEPTMVTMSTDRRAPHTESTTDGPGPIVATAVDTYLAAYGNPDGASPRPSWRRPGRPTGG